MSLRIHVFQHVEFEGPVLIGDWASAHSHKVTFTRFFEGEPLPEANSFDLLIVMGGPMGVNDSEQYPWLDKEIDFLQVVLEKQIPIFGICLGAQLIAKALHSRVYPGSHKEIGWYPISLFEQNFPAELQKTLPVNPVVFHWHGDTFDLPENSKVLASSAATPNQAFLYKNSAIGLQFHLETTEQAVKNLLENAGDEVVVGKYIQSAETMLSTLQYIENNKRLLFNMLNYLERQCC